MLFWMIVALQAVPAAAPGSDARPPLTFTAIRPCPGGEAGEIVVCGAREERYRLPLPAEPPVGAVSTRVAPGGMAALTPPGPCGIFAGERRCGKREAAAYGYGGGRDPVTLLTRLATRAIDPDAE